MPTIEAQVAQIIETEEYLEQVNLAYLLRCAEEATQFAENHPTEQNWRIAEAKYYLYLREWHRLNPKEHRPEETGEE